MVTLTGCSASAGSSSSSTTNSDSSSIAIKDYSARVTYNDYSARVTHDGYSTHITSRSDKLSVTIDNGQEKTFSSFTELCLDRTLYNDIKTSIDEILKEINIVDCNKAEEKLHSLTEIDLSNSRIYNLLPFVWFTNLQKINLSNTQVKNLVYF
nr:hypothetical protein [Trichocoleus desertorum ATA4-8-CV12]